MNGPRPDSSAVTDRAEITRAAATFFAAFTSGPDCGARLDALREVFLPQAVVVRTCGNEPTVYDVDGFIAPRRALLTSGALTQFREWEVSERTHLFGNIAQRLSSYAKSGLQDGTPFFARGVKTLQFVRTAAGWRISAAAWDDERDDSPCRRSSVRRSRGGIRECDDLQLVLPPARWWTCGNRIQDGRNCACSGSEG